MKNVKLVLAVAFLGSLSACAMKTKVLDAGAVSMTRTSLAPDQKLQEVGPVTGQFCSSTFGDKGVVGLIDEAVKNAQETNKVDMITAASFYTTGNGCMTVEGTGQRIVPGHATATNTGSGMIKGKKR
ncbi:hypothetical protein [Bdellovibrio sp. NC01]|uniref:hypothetical protein n=1 Tax=Bdellovibrio sp. NC01 TaxID=2220073 RepID=UPI00115737B0|nr:hypothetical protein [Bdellovibrio sp. NC01]QDK39525.1 hypothetical protein DOE51_18935 [Bdellovibrio sp. NC01]